MKNLKHYLLAVIIGSIFATAFTVMAAAGHTTVPLPPLVYSNQFDINHVAKTVRDYYAKTGILGASNAIETPIALFHSSLANGISAAATTMTLTTATTLDATTLASSTYSFVIDSGQPNQEFVIADCTGTSCTNMQRGLSVVTGTTTIASLQQTHRRTASVDIVDAPLILKLSQILNGISTIPNVLSYTTHPTFTSNTQLVDLQQLNATAFGTVPVLVVSGGTGVGTLPQSMILTGNGTSAITGTSSPTVAYITATSTTATSTFSGNLSVLGSTSLTGNNTIEGNLTSSVQYTAGQNLAQSDAVYVVDSRTYATFDPANKNSQIVLSNGNLTATGANSGNWARWKANQHKTSGKWYYECKYTSGAAGGIAISNSTLDVTTGNVALGTTLNDWSYTTGGTLTHNSVASSSAPAYTTNDIIGVAIDATNGLTTWYKNNVLAGGYNSGLPADIYPTFAVQTDAQVVTCNFGATALTYSPPTGYNPGLYTTTGAYEVDKTNAAFSIYSNSFIGFAKQAYTAGQTATIYTGGLVSNFTSLTPGTPYYLSNTAGLISATAGTFSRKACMAITATQCLITNIW